MSQIIAKRVEVYYSGTVQGVGFRYTTARLARAHPVTGTVRNLPDGRVCLIAEGLPHHLQNFLADIQGRMGDLIRDAETTWGEPRGGHTGFRIVF